jgi:putative PIN family toxin of toxin-antitoxin system
VRVFLDTNVLLSAFFGSGLCARLFEALLESEHDILVGEPVSREFVRIARDKFKVDDAELAPALEVLRRQTLVSATERALVGIPDPDDVPILACALATHAELFVTADRALLDLGAVDGLPLVDPRAAWMRLFGAG